MLEMRSVDVLNNLKGWGMWPQSYHLSESEAQTCIKALEDAVNNQKTGKWIKIPGMNAQCENCKKYFPLDYFIDRPFFINYCPNCGAKMEVSE